MLLLSIISNIFFVEVDDDVFNLILDVFSK